MLFVMDDLLQHENMDSHVASRPRYRTSTVSGAAGLRVGKSLLPTSGSSEATMPGVLELFCDVILQAIGLIKSIRGH